MEFLEKTVRHLLGLLGAWLAAKGVEVDPTGLDVIAGGAMAVASLLWSWARLKWPKKA